jgi:sulfate adenylyltransferase subunit 2
MWDIYNARIRPDEHIRAFPLSNWTELDVWTYVLAEGIRVHPLYFARERDMVERGGALFPAVAGAAAGERTVRVSCRYRTLGCMPCTAAVRSSASTIEAIVDEMAEVRTSERATRVIDHDADGSMERKKREGYF